MDPSQPYAVTSPPPPTRFSRRTIILAGVIVGFLILVGIGLIAFFNGKSTLSITTSGATNDSDVSISIVESSTARVVQTIKASGTTVKVPAGNYTIYAGTPTQETESFVRARKRTTHTLNLSLDSQHAVAPLGSGSQGCDRYIGDTLYSYACNRLSSVLRHDNPTSGFPFPTALSNTAKQDVTVRQYQTGLLGIFNESGGRLLRYLNLPTAKWTNVQRPAGTTFDRLDIITDSSDPINSRFIIVDTAKLVAYSYTSLTDTQPTQINLDEQKNQGNLAYSLRGSTFMFYNGKADAGQEHEVGETSTGSKFTTKKDAKANYLGSIDLDGQSKQPVTTKLSPQIVASGVHFIDATHMALETSSSLDIYIKEDGDYLLYNRLPRAKNVLTTKTGETYFITNNGIYSYDISSNQSHKRFGTGHLKLSQLFTTEEGVSFNAFVEGDRTSTLYSYFLTKDIAPLPHREDKLPYTTTQGLPLLKMDYAKGRIKIQLALKTVSWDRSTGKPTYKQSEYDEAVKKITDQLRKDGVPESMPINFSV